MAHKTHNKSRPSDLLSRRRTILIKTTEFVTGVSVHKALNYFNLYDRWHLNEGSRAALVRARSIHHVVTNYMLGQPNPNYPFLKIKEGLPECLLWLKPLKKHSLGIQAALTITGFYRGEFAPGEPDLSTITKPGCDVTEVTSDILNQDFSWLECSKMIKPPRFIYRGKKGPNGPAFMTSFNEARVLTDQSKDYFEKLEEFSHLLYGECEFNFELRRAVLETAKLPLFHKGELLRKLSIKRELGGKDRVFAMCDYFTQAILQPLHDHLSSILRGIPQDATFDQDAGADSVKLMTLSDEVLYSYDLTAATDRMPISLQKRVMGIILGSESLASRWSHLMVSLPFFYKGQSYHYEVGQGMGTYSSWPIMSLTHHAIVRCAFAKCGVSPEGAYAILGDDIVIKGHEPARYYKTLLDNLGMDISESKSVIGANRAEFAKRIFIQGQEVTPIPVRLVNRLNPRNYFLVQPFFEWLRRCRPDIVGKSEISGPFSEWAKLCFEHNVDDALSIITAPIYYDRYGLLDDRLYPLPSLELPHEFIKFMRSVVSHRVQDNALRAMKQVHNDISRFRTEIIVRGQESMILNASNSELDLGVLPVIRDMADALSSNAIIPNFDGHLAKVRVGSLPIKQLLGERSLERIQGSTLARFARDWRRGDLARDYQIHCKARQPKPVKPVPSGIPSDLFSFV